MRPNSYQPQPQPPSQSQSYPTSLPRSSTFIHQSQPHPTTLPRSSTFVHQPQFRSNPSTSSTSNLQFRSREETREENDLRLALLASQQDHENHLIELERREKLLIEKARKESERAEADRIELEKVRLASIEESERKILESVLRESRLQSQSNHPSNHSTNDHDQYQLELALAISLNESNPTQTSQFEHSSSSHPINNLHHHQPSQPIPLRSTQSASTLQHSTSHSSFTTARTDVNESDSFNHHTSARFTENQHSNSSSYQSSSSFLPRQNTGDLILPQECPPSYDDIAPSIPSISDPQSSNLLPRPSSSNSVLNNHSPLQSSNRDHVLTPTVTSSELHSNRTIRRPSRPLPQPPSRPSSQVQITPLDHSSQRTTHNELHSLRLSTTAPGSQSPSITRASQSYTMSPLVANQPDPPMQQFLNPFEDCYAASPVERDDFPTSLIERPALLIRTRSDQFVPFPDLRDGQEHDTTRPSSATQLCQGEEEEDEAIKEALMRARRASHYSASFIGLENEEGDVFDSHEGSDGTPIQSPTASPSVSDDSKTFVCNPRPSGSLSEGVKYGLIGGSHHSLDSGQFPDVISLSRFASDGSPMKDKGFFVIEAWNWNQLLTYFMWHGNSRIEAGPSDVADAEENRTKLQLALCVEFIQTEPSGHTSTPSTSIRLILEFISGVLSTPRYSKLQSKEESRPALKRASKSSSRLSLINTRSRSSISIQSSSSTNELTIKGLRTTRELIELPKPFLDLPISLSTLASSLHEIHTVARMTTCSSSSTSFLSSSKLGKNTEKLKKLAKWIERQSEGEENGILKEERLMKKGRRWLRRKRKGLMGEIGGNETEKVDGVGLPLPDGATLVQPFDSDWS